MKLNTKVKEYRLLCDDKVIKTWKDRPGVFDLTKYVAEQTAKTLLQVSGAWESGSRYIFDRIATIYEPVEE